MPLLHAWGAQHHQHRVRDGPSRTREKLGNLRNDRKSKMRSTSGVLATPSPTPEQRQALCLKGFLSLLSQGRQVIPQKTVLKAMFAI